MIKGIFFDLGGTLYTYRNLGRTTVSVLEHLSDRLGFDDDIESIIAEHRAAYQAVDQVYAARPFYRFRDYYESIFEEFLTRLGRRDLVRHFDWFEEYQRLTLLGCLELKHDCHQTLDALKSRGFYLSVVSNSDENMLDYLIDRGELSRWFSHWTSSEAARSCKPDRGLFEVALEKSGLNPDQVLFVGDSVEQDVQGAHEVGMTTVLIIDTDHPPPLHVGRDTVDPDFRITNLGMLTDIVDALG